MTHQFAATGKALEPDTGPSVWNQAEIRADKGWHYQLSEQTLAEIQANLKTWIRLPWF